MIKTLTVLLWATTVVSISCRTSDSGALLVGTPSDAEDEMVSDSYNSNNTDVRDGSSQPMDDLADVLEPIRKAGDLPALAAAVFDSDQILALGAVGVRKLGDPTKVTGNDRWHLGSDTKAMTATLTALLVDDKTIAWDTKLSAAFSDWTLDVGYRDVTLTMLLSHRGGAPANVPADVWSEMWKPGITIDQRRVAVQTMLARPPEVTPGTSFLYANAGYMMVGAALEKATGVAWESMMQQRIFNALKMKDCGFGAPATPGLVDQPWGHSMQSGTLTPVAPKPAGDNPPSLGPAGTVNCSLVDWGKFLQVHLKGARGESTFVGKEDFVKMQTPWPGGDYGLGWSVTDRSWGGGKVLTHSGSNTTFFATAWIAPAKNRIFVAVTNRFDDKATQAVDSVFAPLIAKYAGGT